MTRKIRVAIVGLGFGAEFIPIYQRHPNAEMYAICQRNTAKLNEVGDKFGIAKRYTDFAELIADPNVDAVHINSPIDDHAWMSIDALKAGKHVACTVPMARTVEECRLVVEAQKAVGQEVLMMETTVFTREYLFVKELVAQGRAGPHPVPPRGAPPGNGRGQLAGLLARHAADALRDALRRPGARAHRQARRVGLLPRLGPGGREVRRGTTARRSRSRPRTSSSRTRTSMPRSRARSTTRPASTARASTSTAARPASSGSRSRPRSR